jgi:acyl-CoA thioesterase
MSEPGTFASTTAVSSLGPDRWRAAVPAGWDVMENVNGGLLLSIAARALQAATGRPDPFSITGHFLTPGRAGSFEIATEVLREGRQLSTARALVRGADRDVLAVLGTFGELARSSEVLLSVGGPPVLPAPEDCVKVAATDSFPASLVEHVDTRLHPEDATFLEGRPSGSTTLRSWQRLPHGEAIDALGLLYLVDAHPPTIFNADFPLSWTPTLELTVHVRATPAPGWIRSVASTRFVSDGFLEVDVELWDERDLLVAQARQLALVPRPWSHPPDPTPKA